jgi:hypothetical protein
VRFTLDCALMRVGEILLEHGWVDAASLKRAIAEQRHTGKRLCSLLIARGLLDPDHAARALGQQHDVAAVMQRHFENRDRSLVQLLPAALARSCFALPIGRNREGDVIVCVRDPRPELHAVFAQAIGGGVLIAVGPATQLEHLIDLAYEPSPSDEYDVDLTTGPIATIDFESGNGHLDAIPDLSHMTLVELDDDRVVKDASQTNPMSGMRPTTIPPFAPLPMTIDDAVTAIAGSTTRDAATDIAMRYAHGRWVATLLLMIKEGAALGHRGHGTQLSVEAVQAISIPLTAPSVVRAAHDSRRLATEPPPGAGAIHERLERLLGQPRAAMAIPIAIAGRVACVLAVGDLVGSGNGAADLERLATALADAYARVIRDKK